MGWVYEEEEHRLVRGLRAIDLYRRPLDAEDMRKDVGDEFVALCWKTGEVTSYQNLSLFEFDLAGILRVKPVYEMQV